MHGTKSERIEFHIVSKQYTHKTQKVYEGIIPHLERAMDRSSSAYRQRKIESNYMDRVICPHCHGYRINEQAREAFIGEKHIGEPANLTIEELISFLEGIEKEGVKLPEGRALIQKALLEAGKLVTIGLSYLHLNRATNSLSGGENQHLALMTQMSLGLNGCVLILDEPTMGMHELEKANLGRALVELRDSGNTVIIVEHDEKLIMIADQVIDLGPLSGVQGGEIVFQGALSQLKKSPQSLTGRYLSQSIQYPRKGAGRRRKINSTRSIHLTGVSTNNLKNVAVHLPLGVMLGIAGVSGSGKSSLITDTLVPLLKNRPAKHRSKRTALENLSEETLEAAETSNPLEIVRGRLEGWHLIEDCIVVDQSPIGRSRNSFPASYIGLWDIIRKLFASQPPARQRKYQEGHFSFNSDKGRCPTCKREGRIALAISFLDEISLPCEECNGTRYVPEILDITYGGKTIREILNLSVTDALKLFREEERIVSYLKILDGIGMGYMTLGQPATTLSGGEAQRVKLARALGSLKCTNTLFVLDEPSTGLHFHDEVKLLTLLDGLVDQDNSVIIIEHNPNILSFCDYIVEPGPHGGPKGGEIIATGTPEELAENQRSIIGSFLKVSA